jgi:DNA-binding response OmpR family regulator
MLPNTLALVDDDAWYSDLLSTDLRARGVQVTCFGDSNELLTHAEPYRFEFYLVDLMLPGIDGVDLIKVLRRRTDAGVVVVSGRVAPDVFEQVIGAGADMYLTKPLNLEQVALAIRSVHRRAATMAKPGTGWTLDRRARQLVTPEGARVDLSDGDLAVIECFVQAQGEVVTREALRQRLGHGPDHEGTDTINTTIHRLRRRIERCTPTIAPLQARSGVGYVFRAALQAA